MGCFSSKSRICAGKAEDERRGSQHAFDSEADLSDNDYLSTKPKSSVTIPVRQTGPSVAQKCLDEVLPAADDQAAKRGKPIGPVGWEIWKTKKERQTFIRAVLIVLSGNGYRSISDSRIELFFPRCGMDVMAYRAGLAVMDETSNAGDYMSEVATHSFMARQFGVDRKAAFKELMFDIEAMLESHLHNGNTHISRYGIGGGQKELESQLRNRAINSVEESISPAEAAHAMSGDNEPYLRPQTIMTTVPAHMADRNRNYGGFVVGEVERQHSATVPSSHPTAGGVGAVPYGNWMSPRGTAAPLPPRARQMWPKTMPVERPHSYMSSVSTLSLGAQSSPNDTSYSTGHIGSRGYCGAQLDDRNRMSGFRPSMGFMPLNQRSGFSMMPPVPPSSSISDPIAYSLCSPLSDTRQDSTSTSSGPSTSAKIRGLRPSSSMPAMPGNMMPPEKTVRTHPVVSQTSNITPPQAMGSHIVSPVSDSGVPIVKEPRPPLRRRNLIESACNSDSTLYRSQRRNSNRSMKGRPNIKMHYYGLGLNRLEENAAGEEGELFA